MKQFHVAAIPVCTRSSFGYYPKDERVKNYFLVKSNFCLKKKTYFSIFK